MLPSFNGTRLQFSLARRQFSRIKLQKLTGISKREIARYVDGSSDPTRDELLKIAKALNYPLSFFLQDDLPDVNEASVSFQSFATISRKQKMAALAASELGVQLNQWAEEYYYLPQVDVPDLCDFSNGATPEIISKLLRAEWHIGDVPISSMLDLLEAKGIRVLALQKADESVDTFSFWRDGVPFIFLNNFKTQENSNFDLAHELGHLVMHRTGFSHDTQFRSDNKSEQEKEEEANQFASSFLMPQEDVRKNFQCSASVRNIHLFKKRWKVSAFALVRRLQDLHCLPSQAEYYRVRMFLSKLGYRRGEPDGIARDTSKIWRFIVSSLWRKKMSLSAVAQQLHLPLDELQGLILPLISNVVRREDILSEQSVSIEEQRKIPYLVVT